MKLQSRLMGINNRNLKTLQVDLQTSKDLTPALLEEGYTVICESGIATVEDVQAMQAIGVYGFLVGESLMRQPDIAAATRALLVA
jgi:indole-3-glycerol phosphate synthase